MNFNKPDGMDNIKTPENIIKEGVDFVFEQNPELEQIGTKEQYTKYLDSVFPESKIKDIVYHGTQANKFDQFNIDKLGENSGNEGYYGKGFYFKHSLNGAKIHGEVVLPAILNLKNPLIFDQEGQFDRKNLLYKYDILNEIYKNNDGVIAHACINNERDFISEINVFNENNIQILDSKEDIENFKKFVSENKE